MATYDYYGEEMETGIPVDELAFETMIRRFPVIPPLSTIEVQEHVEKLREEILGDDSSTDTEPGPEESGG